MWVIEQKSKHGNNSRYLLGKSIQEKPEEIGNFFSHLPSYVPRIDSLISENCYIPYK